MDMAVLELIWNSEAQNEEVRVSRKKAFTRERGFPGGSDGKKSACDVGEQGSIAGLGRSPGEGHGNPLQYSCLENSMDRGAWWATVHGVTKSQTLKKRKIEERERKHVR